MAGLTAPVTESEKLLLNSWKAIAVYLDRGVRTVQRWERELGLHVRRITRSNRGPVFAFRAELDLWLAKSSSNPHTRTEVTGLVLPSPIKAKPREGVLNQIRVSTESIRSGTEQLYKLIARLQSLMQQQPEKQLPPLPAEVAAAGAEMSSVTDSSLSIGASLGNTSDRVSFFRASVQP